MNVTLTQIGAATEVDLTPYLDDDSETRLSQSSEDSAFQREVDDVHLKLSDRDGTFSRLFAGTSGLTKWVVTIADSGRTLFRGQIKNRTITLTPDDLWMECDVFSMNRAFWDVAKQTKVHTRIGRTSGGFEKSEIYKTLQYVLERELTGLYRSENAFDGLFNGFDWGGYDSDPIRFSKLSVYQSSNRTTFYADSVVEDGTNFGGVPFQIGSYITAFQKEKDGTLRNVYGRINRTINANGQIFVDNWEDAIGGLPPNGRLTFSVGVHPSIGLDGLWTSLDPDTTMDELLQAVAKEKNAEFFIDPETQKFTMRARRAVLNDRANTESLNIDTVLLEGDVKPKIQLIDDNQYDYVKINLGDIRPPKPTYVSQTQKNESGGLYGYGDYYYQLTLMLDNFETNGSDILNVYIPGSSLSDPVWDRKAWVKLIIPASDIPGVTSRRLYRSDFSDPEKKLRFLTSFEGNTQTTYTDKTHHIFDGADPYLIANTLYPPQENQSVGMWIRYDETTAQWEDPVFNLADAVTAPQGNILDVTPSLQFVTLNDKTKRVDNPEYHTMKFFGSENYSEKYRDRWKPEFQTRRRVTAGVMGLNYRVGDTIRSRNMIFGNDITSDDRLLIRKASNLLKQEETELEMVTI